MRPFSIILGCLGVFSELLMLTSCGRDVQLAQLTQSTQLAVPTSLATGTFDSSAEQCVGIARDIAEKFACLEGVSATEVSPGAGIPMGIRRFELQFTQPVDHGNARRGTFRQRVVVLHRDESEPVVLQTSGYAIFGVREAAITRVFATNQVQVEHRYFKESRPKALDWTFLDIEQSARDFHAITVALKKIYGGRWVNTGASKGGMTSVFHRWFFPGDVDGTVADVAPLSFSTSDARYTSFVETVGGDQRAQCREDLQSLQRSLLEQRDQIVPKLLGNFEFLGGADVAFEHAVIEAAFVFWQYGNPDHPETGCAAIPKQGSARENLDFLNKINKIENYESSSIQEFLPYYYQAATQLGNPGNSLTHVSHLLRHEFTIDQYTPRAVDYTYSNAAMVKLDRWVRQKAKSLMFVYGELDPWTAGAFPAGAARRDNFKFTVPGGNHGAKFTDLTDSDRSRAVAVLERWLGKAPVAGKLNTESDDTLEALEMRARRKL